MANILILSRFPLSQTPYHDWLPGHRLFVFAPADLCERQEAEDLSHRHGCLRVEVLDDYDSNGLLEWSALDLHREVGLDFVVAGHEFDLIRAARLRQRLGLPGQQEASAIAFRNKVAMKEIISRAGLRVPRFQLITSALDAISFAESVGFPLVIKPLLGAASVQVHILRSSGELKELLQKGVLGGPDAPLLYQVEEFIEGDLYHVDGIVSGGSIRCIWSSRYLDHCVTFRQGRPTGSYMLSPDNPLGERLRDFVSSCLAAMPLHHDTTFHAEVFHSSSDELILCEIASRTAGGPVAGVLRSALGIDLREVATQLQAGIASAASRDYGLLTPTTLAGWVVFPIPDKPRRLRSIPHECPFSWVSEYSTAYKAGDVVANRFLFHFLAAGIVQAASEDELVQRIDCLILWYEERLQWDESGAAPPL